MHRSALVIVLAVFVAPLVHAQRRDQEQRAASAVRIDHPRSAETAVDLRASFANAAKNPSAVAALILDASGEIASLPPERARLLADTLEPFSRRAFFGPERLPGMESLGLALHSVERGETLSRIAQRYRIGAGLIGMLNADVDESRLSVGRTLKVLDLSDKSLAIEVHTATYRAFAWKRTPSGRRALVASWTVGLGARETPTPHGRTVIEKRVLDPQWTHPVTKEVFPPHHPENILGGFWIGLSSDGLQKSGIGFHGYTGDEPAKWLEQPASNGCVRMLQPDVNRLYQLALEGTPVAID